MFTSWREISRSVRTGSVGVVFAALAVMLPSAPATAEFIITPNDEMGGVGSLLSWSYTVDGMSISLDENWGEIDPVALFIVDSASTLFGSRLFGDPGLGGTLIGIEKDILNTTDFDWTSFHIDLIPIDGGGPITVDPDSVGSDRFSNVDVMNNDDGSASMWFFTDKGQGDTPVLIGEQVVMFFDMTIFGAISFTMIQTPVPAPGALALLGLAGAVSRRRRRN
ncbi:MAG: PEP-CTERM sorting domain-containing protein [Phycisphaerales bacterium]